MSFKRMLAVGAAVVLALVSLGLGSWANSSIRLGLLVAHTPVSWAAAVLPGPAAVQGRVEVDQESLTGPFTNAPCVYFRKHVEREKRDSEGRTSWETVEDIHRSVPFQLTDKSGSLLVRPQGAEVRAPQVHQHRSGEMRYTEYALAPGREVFVFGTFDGERYRSTDGVPFLVSGLGEKEYRQGKGVMSLTICSLAILSASFAVYFLCVGFRWHHVFVYLGLLTSIVPLWLFVQWFTLASSQFVFADKVLQAAADHIAKTPQDTVSSALLKEVYNDGVRRLVDYRSKLPNRPVAWYAGVRRFEPLELSATEREWTVTFPLRPRPSVALPAWAGIVFGLLGAVALLALTASAFKRLKTKRLIENLPTTPAAGVVVGAAELSGTPVSESSWLLSRYSQSSCAWYRYETKEKRGSGKNTRWVVIESGAESTPFLLQDDSGQIRVHPDQAKVTGRQVLHERQGRQIKSEWIVDEADPLYVLGPARLVDPDDDFLSIAHGEDAPYMISIQPESEIQLSFARRGFLFANFALIGGTVALMTLMSLRGFSPFDFFVAGLFPLLYLGCLTLFFMYNDLVFLRQRMHRALAMIDVALKKRSDLVPQLVDVTRAYLSHEKETQQALTAMRAAPGESVANIEEALVLQATGVLKWLGVVEQHPDLKGNEVVLKLQHRLGGLENEIAFCRQSYNDTLERYNTRIGTLPDLLMAKVCRFQVASFLTYESQIRNTPSVSV